MEGITILNSYEHLTNLFTIFALVILCVIFFRISVTALVELVKYGYDSWKQTALLVVCITFTVICGCCIPAKKYETYYQVTIDGSVSMNEFQSKYDIIKVEGKIYTVKEVDKTMED